MIAGATGLGFSIFPILTQFAPAMGTPRFTEFITTLAAVFTTFLTTIIAIVLCPPGKESAKYCSDFAHTIRYCQRQGEPNCII